MTILWIYSIWKNFVGSTSDRFWPLSVTRLDTLKKTNMRWQYQVDIVNRVANFLQ